MSGVSIAIFSSHGVPALRALLRDVREGGQQPQEIQVFVSDCPEELGLFLGRQYLRGRIKGFHVDPSLGGARHCGLDRAHRFATGEYLVRLDDTLELRPGWLERSVAALEADSTIGCLSLVPPSGYHRGRGRPRTVHVEPLPIDHLDMRCYITPRRLATKPSCVTAADGGPGGCGFQRALGRGGLRLAYLPGLAKPLDLERVPQVPSTAHEGDLPLHEGASGAMQRLQQAYRLGDDVLLTCLSCGAPELEVLAARILFCDAHWVATGHMYELRCPACKELFYRDDPQFRCPQ